jgi:predicted nicotinamide N-methyase
MAQPFLARVRQHLIRAGHRASDFVDLAAFSLCPLPSWSTQLCLPATTNHHSVQSAKGRAAINLKIDQWTSLGSGGFVWNGCRRLAAQLQRNGDGQKARPATLGRNGVTLQPAHLAVASRSWAGLNVIELGAGTGMLGIAVAAMGANVTLTDQATFVYPDTNSHREGDAAQLQGRSLLDLLKRNAAQNLSLTQEPGQQIVQVHEMLWGSASHHSALPHPTFDVIVAADVLLFQSAQRDLLNTLHALSTPQTVILIEHTDRSGGPGETYPGDLLNFLEKLEDENTRPGGAVWDPQIIHDHGRHITLRISRRDDASQNQEDQNGDGVAPFKLENLPPRRPTSS